MIVESQVCIFAMETAVLRNIVMGGISTTTSVWFLQHAVIASWLKVGCSSCSLTGPPVLLAWWLWVISGCYFWNVLGILCYIEEIQGTMWKGESKGEKGSHLSLDTPHFLWGQQQPWCIFHLHICLFLYILAEAHSIRKERDFFGHLLKTKQCRPNSGILLLEAFCFTHTRKNLTLKALLGSKKA